jgi:hypothetical protein
MVLADPDLKAELSRRGYMAVQKFTYTKIACSLDEALRNLLGNKEIHQA